MPSPLSSVHIERAALWMLLLITIVVTASGQSAVDVPAPEASAPIALEDQHSWRAEDDEVLEGVDEDLAARVRWIQEELWQRGHAARIARGRRTVEAQREGFLEGHSKTLRSKHLCDKAVDFKLHLHDYPDADHPFWDVKDRLAKEQKLLVLNAPSFRDRPHVELDADCDWDSVGLGPEGIWSTRRKRARDGAKSTASPQRLEVRLNRETGRYEGSLLRGERRHELEDLQVRHLHSGERNSFEEAIVEATFASQGDETFTITYTVSSITSKSHGYVRADWRSLTPRKGGGALYRTSK